MPIFTNLHRSVSNRGQWRGYYHVASRGPVDTDRTVFTLTIRCLDHPCCGQDDYGFGHRNRDCDALISTTTEDETHQFAASGVDSGVACTWLFSAQTMRRFCAGSYEASIFAEIGDEDAELARFNFVVR